MAGVAAPLFGLDASGTIGKAITFSKWRGRPYVRTRVIPANPQSGLQVGMRSGMKFLSQDFANLTAAQKATWDTLAAVDNITQLNAQVRHDQALLRRNLGILQTANAAAGETASAPATFTATAQPKTIVLDWTAGVTAPSYCWLIYRSLTTGFTVDVSNLIAIVSAATLTYTDIGRTTGVPLYYKIRGCSTGGTLGALSAEATGTPT